MPDAPARPLLQHLFPGAGHQARGWLKGGKGVLPAQKGDGFGDASRIGAVDGWHSGLDDRGIIAGMGAGQVHFRQHGGGFGSGAKSGEKRPSAKNTINFIPAVKQAGCHPYAEGEARLILSFGNLDKIRTQRVREKSSRSGRGGGGTPRGCWGGGRSAGEGPVSGGGRTESGRGCAGGRGGAGGEGWAFTGVLSPARGSGCLHPAPGAKGRPGRRSR